MLGKTVIITGSILLLTGCITAPKSNIQVSKNTLAHVDKICIQKNMKISNTDQYLDEISNRLHANNINTVVYTDKKPADCRYTMSYIVKHNWDVVKFVSLARVFLYEDGLLVKNAEYRVRTTFDLTKWKSSQYKIDPLIDELLARQ